MTLQPQNATYFKNMPAQNFHLGDRFTGNMDEVRIWNNVFMDEFTPISNVTVCPAEYSKLYSISHHCFHFHVLMFNSVSKAAMYFTFEECSGNEVGGIKFI